MVKISKYSGADIHGGMVFYDEDKNFYRIFYKKNHYYENVLKPLIADKDYLKVLFEWGLIRFELIADDFLPDNLKEIGDYGIMKLEKIYSFSHAQHRPARQMLDLLKMVCQLNLLLTEKNLIICNYHEADINMKGCKPVFVDLGSITVMSEESLRLSYNRLFYLVVKYLFLSVYEGTHENFDLFSYSTENQVPTIFTDVMDMMRVNNLMTTHKELLIRILRYFDEHKCIEKEKWVLYQDQFTKTRERLKTNKLSSKEKPVYDLLLKYKEGNQTLFDVGCNKGQFSIMAAILGYDVFALDFDEQSLGMGYQFCQTQDDIREKILFLKSDFYNFFIAPQKIPAGSERYQKIDYCNIYKSDVVMCLAFMHHWVKNHSFRDLASRLDRLCLNILILEYVPVMDEDQVMNEIIARGFIFKEDLSSNVSGRKIMVFKRKRRKERIY